MAFSQDERIQISKKIIDIPLANANFDDTKASLEENLIKATNEDNANKSLMDDKTVFINPYQLEIAQLDSNVRTELKEQDVIDGANKIKQNFFFPNDVNTSLPSIPDGIWKFLTPFSGSIAIGKNYTEAFPSATAKEQDKIDPINTQISIIESAIAGTRSTGLECLEDLSGTCIGGSGGATEGACTGGGGTWSANNGPDTYSPEAVIQQALIDIGSAIGDWKTFLITEKSFILTTDTDTARQAQNDIAIADIDNTISIIDTWIGFDDWDTTTTLPSGSGGTACAAFAAMISGDFTASKLRDTELQTIKDEITARLSFITIRIAELTVNLGSVGQNLSTGEIDGSGSGLYEARYQAINVRLNLLGGSLNKKLGIIRSQEAQDAQKDTNDLAAALYDTAMKVSTLRAPAAGTGTIHVLDASAFSIGDVIYVVAEKQLELTGTISNISGNTVFLDFDIPAKYTHENSSRLYKGL